MEGGVYIKKAKNFVRDKMLDLANKLDSEREPSAEVIKPWDRNRSVQVGSPLKVIAGIENSSVPNL